MMKSESTKWTTFLKDIREPKNLSDVKWEYFSIDEIFTLLIRGNNKRLEVIGKGDGRPYIGAKYNNNGVTGFVKTQANNINIFKGNAIVFIMTGEGSVGKALYKSESFIPSSNVYVGYSNHLNKYNSNMIVTMINKQEDKYSYGYIRNDKRLKRERILLPVNLKNEPDYAYMESCIKDLKEKKEQEYFDYISKRIKYLKGIKRPAPLEEKEWKGFKITEIFNNIQRGKRFKKDDHIKGDIPYVSSTALNNGIDAFIGNNKNVRFFENCLTIANSGSVGATFYQAFKIIASDHVTKLQNRNLSKYAYFFVAVLLERLSAKYSFNREINDKRLKKEKIMLPINNQGQPDYEYMEQYMKYLEYQKLSTYLEFKK